MAIHKKTKGHLDKSSIIKSPKLIYEKREKQSFEEDELDKMNKIDGVEIVKQFGNPVVTIRVNIDREAKQVFEYREKLEEVLFQLSDYHHKISISVFAQFDRQGESVTHPIQSPMESIISRNQAIYAITNQLNYIKTQIEERYFQGSGLTLNKIESCDMTICSYKRCKGGHFIKLPFKTKAVINVESNDNKCFLWSLLASKFVKENPKS
ncbi:hypothetical protein, partial [Bartonella sp. CL34QHWL]|uniref:hypothetical protein n=1 Tax=Bartonella sp. CL34QHWL TaxID=3243526 RepID=UPI0035CF7D4C